MPRTLLSSTTASIQTKDAMGTHETTAEIATWQGADGIPFQVAYVGNEAYLPHGGVWYSVTELKRCAKARETETNMAALRQARKAR